MKACCHPSLIPALPDLTHHYILIVPSLSTTMVASATNVVVGVRALLSAKPNVSVGLNDGPLSSFLVTALVEPLQTLYELCKCLLHNNSVKILSLIDCSTPSTLLSFWDS